ncbi:MAG: HTH domain-containing protein [Phycisphaerales bacterium JB038]
MLTDEEAKRRDGMVEILMTLKTRAAAVRQAKSKGPDHFVITHEDGRFGVARGVAPATPSDQEAPAIGSSAPDELAAKPGAARAKPSQPAKRGAANLKREPEAAGLASSNAPKRLSALDAAAQVLAKARKPMRAKELIEQMAKQGLWTSPGGKTPEATLYSAMSREITKKGSGSRFKKADRGMFSATGKGGA